MLKNAILFLIELTIMGIVALKYPLLFFSIMAAWVGLTIIAYSLKFYLFLKDINKESNK
jgi:hypothetical protein